MDLRDSPGLRFDVTKAAAEGLPRRCPEGGWLTGLSRGRRNRVLLPESFIRSCRSRICTFGAPVAFVFDRSLFPAAACILLWGALYEQAGRESSESFLLMQMKTGAGRRRFVTSRFDYPVSVPRTQSPTSQYLKSCPWLTCIAPTTP